MVSKWRVEISISNKLYKFFNRLQFDQTFLCTLPRESRLCLMLCGVKTSAVAGKAGSAAEKGDKSGAPADKGEVTEGNKIILPLGAAAVQLFNEKG